VHRPRNFSITCPCAQASLAEVETQLEISVRLNYLAVDQVAAAVSSIQKLGKQLHALRNALEARK
jgi:four helix bundle protein